MLSNHVGTPFGALVTFHIWAWCTLECRDIRKWCTHKWCSHKWHTKTSPHLESVQGHVLLFNTIGGQSSFRHYSLGAYVLTTSRITSKQIPTWDSTQWWRLHSAAPQGDHATSTMIRYPTHSNHPATVQTNSFHILLLTSARLGSVKYDIYESVVWLSQLHGKSAHILIRPSRLVTKRGRRRVG